MNKFWNNLYALPTSKAPKKTHASKRECEKLAKEKGVEIQFNFYGRRKHKMNNILSEGYDELLGDLELI